ncbi:fructose-1,6-bisphosphatase [Halarchaeum sp. CBA1220]|uniref:class 1 fructose-bisphosphatase n=1 Tax=Halarchaeum sp. CBA1220 TaxID=1853682 RepID=UPI000F3A8B66|nr:class 1 fructose-bisphosphatase [Halarchaeum sp. CBA1220]QLC34152.1 fructose-1,6-bisphosphatase [Halarchaeum sp. CBA1220]
MATSDADDVLDALAAAALEVRAGFAGRREKTDGQNASGDQQLHADLHADDVLRNFLGGLDAVGEYASEEAETVQDVGDGPLSVSVDPLDGSSNLTANNPTGTIVGVYDAPLPAPGTDLVAAAYVLYGPLTTMVVARDGAVTRYAVTETGRENPECVDLPSDPTVYGFGGRTPEWPEPFADYADDVEDDLKLRYGGAMVADVNQVLTYGGVFAYPGLRERPEGKLRAQFEAAPMAYIVECAGGASTDGSHSVLEIEPGDLHARTPVFLGNDELIQQAERALA